MSDMPADFDTPHNEAFRSLEALEPGQHWSAFDVPRELARQGKATRLVTTIWNYHSRKDARGHRTATELAIRRDAAHGTLWYRIAKPGSGETSTTWVAHWNGLQLAVNHGIPIVGVLKDVRTNRCSLAHLFDCGPAHMQLDGTAMWLQLTPRSEVGCATLPIDIREEIGPRTATTSLIVLIERFEAEVRQAMRLTAEQRLARLTMAPKIPKRIEVTTSVFERNSAVVAEVLVRAQGVCGACGRAAPFLRRKDGSPYLEVHHRIRLAVGGEDSVENAIALCPNCHRFEHYA